MGVELTRQRFLRTLGVGAAGTAMLGAAGCGSSKRTRKASLPGVTPSGSYVRTFLSRPDLLPPAIQVRKSASGTAPGYIFISPAKGPGQYGPMILDDQGQTVWFDYSREKQVRDFRAQSYRGEPVLTWWEGRVSSIRGLGEYVVLDDSYSEIARLEAANGLSGDLHEFIISPDDTALVTIYSRVRRDLTPFGGPDDAAILDGVIQELDIETGELLFEWRSLDHVGVDEAYIGHSGNPDEDFDYFHINSIDVDHDGHLLVSARNTWAVYKIDRDTGEVIWRLGGRQSDFEMGPGTGVAFQHDARRQPDGTITIFDNGSHPPVRERSRAIVVELDMDAMSATMKREYVHPNKRLLAGYLGSMQTLPNDNVFVGWGAEPFFSEFSRDGELLFDARLPIEYTSYRSYRMKWKGYPEEEPAVAAERRSGGGVTLYASWNGATEVAVWEALAGPERDRLRPAATALREGFETTIGVQTEEPYVAARALDDAGRTLGVSEVIEL
ncbi:arylsulfotransferase family protein [Rubrobacter aplysinae]|uniref:arylsulfotransferase family protein n=1 Tax=Rubrobacter aplysinae TaxID=909625 RepID=UPI00069DFD80|nr:arylsulfotransferase family protein [Rubrobacter aplysinae]